MILSAIVAAAENGVIGRGGKLPWHLPRDLKRFKTLTMGHAMIMGRKTFESIGRPLPGRRSVVLTRGSEAIPGAVVAHSWDEVLAAVREETEAFVIGGAEVFAAALPHCHRLYLTLVEARIDGDVRIELPDPETWKLTARESHPADARHAYPFTFLDYQRRS